MNSMKRAFINGIILNGKKNIEPVEGRAILVEDNRITAVVDAADIDEYELVDLKGNYVLPGLINLHVHLAGDGKPKKKATDPVKAVKLVTSTRITRAVGKKMVEGYAKTELMSGVTTIRTVGGIANFDTWLRDEINKGNKIGPRILASNMAISVPDGHMANSLGYVAHNAEEAKNYVDKVAKDNPDWIKLMITGGVMDAEVVGEPGVLRMQPEIVKAACDRAHELGYKVCAHVESPLGVKVAIENGVDSIEHGAKVDEATMDLMKERGIFQVSTISPALPYALFDRSISHATYEQQENGKIVFNGIIDMAKECLKRDIPVGLGTDTACPYITQYDMWRELYYFVKYCGVSNAFALYSATLLNAELAGVGEDLGSIEAGKFADMIVVKKNPLEDLTALRELEMVVKDGIIYDHPVVKKLDNVEKELDKFL